jgi:hypothetical protein
MKKLVYLFSMLLFLLATATGCSDWGEAPELNILELESANVSFDELGGTGEIVVKSTAGVTASSAATWCTATASGNKVTVTVPVYEELLGRSTMVTVVSGGKNVQVPVTQAGLEFKIGSTIVELPSTASDTALQVTCRLPVTVQSSSATWLAVSLTADKVLELHAVALPNGNFGPRTATVTLTFGVFEAIITVNQQHILSFNEYLGTWTFTHTTAEATSGTKYNKRAFVTNGGGYLDVELKNGTATTSATMFHFTMDYNAITGRVNIPAQKVFENNGVDVILAGFNGSSNFVTDGGLNGTPTSGTFARPVLTFTNDGTTSITAFSYIGFILIELPNYIYNGFGTAASNNRYTNITMTKQ